MPLTDSQRSFLSKYLGTAAPGLPGDATKQQSAPPDPGTSGQDAPADVLKIWRDAKESTDGGISALQSALKGYDHPALTQIAESGLNGVTEGNQVAMMRALMDYQRSPAGARGKAASAVLKQVDAYRGFLDRSGLIVLAENNPFGVTVAIRKPLGEALSRIAREVNG